MKRLLLLTIMAALCLCPMDAQKQKRSGKRSAKESTEAKAERLFNEAEDFYFGTDKVFMNREKAAELYRSGRFRTIRLLAREVCRKRQCRRPMRHRNDV